MFDLSIPQEHVASTLMEYNSLHDPYLKSYFHQSSMRDKLKKNGFITEGLDVVCSLKKYNAYRHFLEGEFLKIHQKNMADVEEVSKVYSSCVLPTCLFVFSCKKMKVTI